MNLVDGMNGLAGGVAAIACSFMVLLGLGQGDAVGRVLSLALLGAVVGFLPHNFPRARVFLGDNGSLFLGFMLAVLALRISSQPYHLGSFLAPILILGVPVGDTFLAILRRASHRGQQYPGLSRGRQQAGAGLVLVQPGSQELRGVRELQSPLRPRHQTHHGLRHSLRQLHGVTTMMREGPAGPSGSTDGATPTPRAS